LAFTQTLSGSNATLVGTSGNDSVLLTNATSGSITANAFEGTDFITTAANVSGSTIGLGANADGLTLGGTLGSSTVKMGDGADTFTTGANLVNTSTLLGGGGLDTFTIQGGTASRYQGGQGTDTFTTATTASANATMVGGSETDTFNLGAADTSIFVNGQKGIDVINITSLVTGTIRGGSEDDAIVMTAASTATMYGDKGSDTLTANGNAASSIFGGKGGDQITGAAGADTITGGSGNDIFVYTADTDGSAGAITRAGVATGAVALAAGDVVTLGAAGAVETITDFAAGDRLNTVNGVVGTAATQLIGVAANGTSNGAGAAGTTYFASGNYNAATRAFTITAAGTGSSTLVLLDGGQTGTEFVILEGTNSSVLNTTTFL